MNDEKKPSIKINQLKFIIINNLLFLETCLLARPFITIKVLFLCIKWIFLFRSSTDVHRGYEVEFQNESAEILREIRF